MPLIDMPLEELKTYGGRNPRPADFDQYWDRALAEMRAVDPKVELRPYRLNAPAAECFDLFFTGVRGARVHAKYLRPAGIKEKHPAVLLFHGYTGSSGEWASKLRWIARGFSVAALDCRGQGGTSEDSGGVAGTTWRGHIIRGLDGQPEDLLFRQILPGHRAACANPHGNARGRSRAGRRPRRFPGRRAHAGLRGSGAADQAGHSRCFRS